MPFDREDHPIRRLLGWIGRQEPFVLLAMLLAAAAVWGFIELAEEVLEGETHFVDEAILLALRNPADRSDPLGPVWVEELARDVTALGGIGILTALTLAVAGFLALSGRVRAVAVLLAGTGGGLVLSTLLKYGFDRPRPDLVPHGAIVYTASFPSGHSMMAAATYLTLGALLARVLPNRRLKAYVLILGMLFAVAVGVSRVYLGVHWPSDVLAGWTAGAAWALGVWLVARGLQRRGKMEAGAPEDRAGGT